MKHTFVLVHILFGVGYVAAVAAHLGGSLPFDILDFTAAFGGYTVAGLVTIALHDYARRPVRLLLDPPPAPAAPKALALPPRPTAPLTTSGAAAWALRTLSP